MFKQLLKSTAITGAMTFLSRVLGFVRDIIIARYFGASVASDAFLVAFKIPNFLRKLFAEGAFSQAFVPVLSEYKVKQSDDEVQSLIDHVSGYLSLILLIITVIAIIAAPVIIMISAPGYVGLEDGRYKMSYEMLRITFPYLFLISLTALGGAILNTYGRFAVPAFAPVLLNACMILSSILLSEYFVVPIYALAVGVALGGVAQLLFMVPFLKKLGKLPRPRFSRKHKGVKKIIKLIIPALFGVSVSQINLLLDTMIASFLEVKSVTWLYYADRLLEFPLGIFGVALATVVLPSLSQDNAAKDSKSFSLKLDWSLRVVLLIATPAALGLFLLAQPMLITLFQYGQFTLEDTSMSSWALKAYSLGLLAFIFIKVLANGYYSRQDTKTPVKIGIIAMIVNMVLNLLIVGLMVYFDFVAPHTGLAIATTGSAIINAWLLYRGLKKQGVYSINSDWNMYVLKIFIALVAMGFTIIMLSPDVNQWHQWDAMDRSLNLTVIIFASMISYFITAFVLRIKFLKIKEI